ncbi:MAG TPA: allene oxide cyclase family protein [Actinomycetota bacterium]|nr:allene oxide cyclase family protein [Actinomycetota bacterium]
MRRKLALIVAMVLVGASIIAVLVASSSAQPVTTIKVIEHAVTDKVIDVGKTGDSPGDLLTFHNKVYDDADANVVGRDQGSCVRISPKQGTWECVYTTLLEGGSITVETPFYDTADSVGAITGGTGTYAGAGGSIDLHCYVGDDDVARCDFTFNLN